MVAQLVPIIFMAFLSLAFGGILLFVVSKIGKTYKSSKAKMEAYESGISGQATSTTKVPVKFYLTAISFIIFDIEAIFIYPWAITFRDFIQEGYGVYALSVMSFFLFFLIWGLFYEWKSRALEWE